MANSIKNDSPLRAAFAGEEKDQGDTLASQAFRRLRDEIVRNELAPNAKLGVRQLVERYGVGASPLREALSRLVGDGLVTLEGQKGFRVAPISRKHMLEIADARQVAEVGAFKLALERGDADWEAEVLGAFHRLRRATGETLLSTNNADWERFHKEFHRALIAACGVASLIDFCQTLYDQATRYRHLLFHHDIAGRHLIDEHQVLLDVVLARDVEGGGEALYKHMRLTVDVMTRNWEDNFA